MLKNEDAAYEIVSWDGTVNRVTAGCCEKKGEIKEPLKNILMEGLKKRVKTSVNTSAVNSSKASKKKINVTKSLNKSSSIKKITKQPSRNNHVSALDRLKSIIQDTGDIVEYAIFSDRGSLLANHSKSDGILKCRASSYVQFSEHLNHLVIGGKLRYIVLSKEDNIRYIMFAHEKARITVAVTPGFRTEEFLKKIAA